MTDQAPAFVPEAERAVLGSMLISKHAARQAIYALDPIDFYRDAHRQVFAGIQDMLKQDPEAAIDIVTVNVHLRQTLGTKWEGSAILKEAQDAVANATNFESYVRIVRGASLDRKIDQQLTKTNSDRSPENVRVLGDLILSAEGNNGCKVFDMRKDLADILDSMVEKPIPGFKSGINAIDEVMRCYRPGELYTIGARPGGGKTALMLKMFGSFAAQGHECLYITTEMRMVEILQRIFAMATGIDHWRFRGAKLDLTDHSRIHEISVGLSEYPMMIAHRSRPGLADIRTAILAAKPKVVFVDYLQRCKLPKMENMAYMLQEFYVQLKEMVDALGVTCFIGAQTDRELDRNPLIRPAMAHLKGSGGIESESDGVMMLWEPPKEFIAKLEDFVPPKPGCTAMEFVVRKNRNGPKDVVADLQLDGRVINILERKRPGTERNQGESYESY